MKPGSVLLLLAPLFLLSCGEDPLSGEKRGNVEGVVMLRDEFGTTINNASGVTVRFEEASKSATTDSKGKWRITDLPAGIHTVTISKEGFGTYKVFGYQFVGGGTAFMELMSLATRPSYTIEDITVTADEGTMIHVAGRVANAEGRHHIPAVIFIGTDPTVSSEPGKHVASHPLYLQRNADGTFETEQINLTPLLPVTSGETYYLVIYSGPNPITYYLDPHAGELIYPSLSTTPSSVAAVTIP